MDEAEEQLVEEAARVSKSSSKVKASFTFWRDAARTEVFCSTAAAAGVSCWVLRPGEEVFGQVVSSQALFFVEAESTSSAKGSIVSGGSGTLESESEARRTVGDVATVEGAVSLEALFTPAPYLRIAIRNYWLTFSRCTSIIASNNEDFCVWKAPCGESRRVRLTGSTGNGSVEKL